MNNIQTNLMCHTLRICLNQSPYVKHKTCLLASTRFFCAHKSVDLNFTSIPPHVTSTHHQSPLIILHGLFGQISNWSSMSKALHAKLHRPVVVADLRNHGSSPHVDSMSYEEMAVDVERLILKVSPSTRKCVLLGHSMGGKIACHLACTKPQLIERLIIEDIVPRSVPVNNSTNLLPVVNAMSQVKFDSESVTEARQDANRILEENGLKDEATRQFILLNITEKDGRIAWKLNLESIAKFMRDGLYGFPNAYAGKQISLPTLFVFGRKSGFYNQETDDNLLKSIFSNLSIQVVENCGHWVHSQRPKEFLAAVVNFLRT